MFVFIDGADVQLVNGVYYVSVTFPYHGYVGDIHSNSRNILLIVEYPLFTHL